MDDNLVEFWKNSAEFINSEIRDDTFEDMDDKELLSYYKENLDLMDKEMKTMKNVTKKQRIYYRSTVLNSFEMGKPHDIINVNTNISCFLDNFDDSYGPYEIMIRVPENVPYLTYENVIIFPPSKLKILTIDSVSCLFELIK